MRRSRLVAAIAVAIVAVLVVVAVVVVTRDDGSERLATADWAASVCTSLGEWQSSIGGLADVSGQTLTPDLLRRKLDEGSAATDDLVTALEELGPPDVEAANEVEAALDDAAAGIRARYTSLETAAADATDAGSREEFFQALAALGPRFQELLGEAEGTISSLQSASLFGESSAELEQAFSESQACRALRETG